MEASASPSSDMLHASPQPQFGTARQIATAGQCDSQWWVALDRVWRAIGLSGEECCGVPPSTRSSPAGAVAARSFGAGRRARFVFCATHAAKGLGRRCSGVQGVGSDPGVNALPDGQGDARCAFVWDSCITSAGASLAKVLLQELLLKPIVNSTKLRDASKSCLSHCLGLRRYRLAVDVPAVVAEFVRMQSASCEAAIKVRQGRMELATLEL